MICSVRYLLLIFLACLIQACQSESPKNSPANSSNITEIEHELTVSTGSIKRFQVDSKYVDNRNVDVWLPDGYTSTKQYAVLYMHDGQMLFDSTKTWNKQEWHVDETAGQLIAQNKILSAIIVGIWNNGKKRAAEYFPEKVIQHIPESQRDSLLAMMPGGINSDNYLKFIVDELKPLIDTQFSTFTGRKNTFVMGSSFGGLISIYAISEYPQVFGGAVGLSTHWTGTLQANDAIPNAINNYLMTNLPDSDHHTIYFDHGTETLDANYPPYQNLIDKTMQQNGYSSENWISREFPGADHSEQSWSARLDIPLRFLLGKN